MVFPSYPWLEGGIGSKIFWSGRVISEIWYNLCHSALTEKALSNANLSISSAVVDPGQEIVDFKSSTDMDSNEGKAISRYCPFKLFQDLVNPSLPLSEPYAFPTLTLNELK